VALQHGVFPVGLSEVVDGPRGVLLLQSEGVIVVDSTLELEFAVDVGAMALDFAARLDLESLEPHLVLAVLAVVAAPGLGTGDVSTALSGEHEVINILTGMVSPFSSELLPVGVNLTLVVDGVFGVLLLSLEAQIFVLDINRALDNEVALIVFALALNLTIVLLDLELID